MKKTKIIATLGPASSTVEIMKELLQSGLSAGRINFSHGSHEEHGDRIAKFKQAREELGLAAPLVLDTKGPEIRTKDFNENKVQLIAGNKFTITTDDIIGDDTKVAVTYADFAKDLKPGNRVLIDDGLVELVVESIEGNNVHCRIVNSGVLSHKKGVNLPDSKVNLPAITQKDIDDIKFGITQGFDYIAASFIRSAADVLAIRKVLEENNGTHIEIISKIENREGVENIDSILEVTDGIMVARGDLGVEIPPEEVPLVQKMLIEKCNRAGKLVVTATQMLESMITNPRPTRAEASDVANAIFDGTDCIMLSGETAKGDYPVNAVQMMTRIATMIEASDLYANRTNIPASSLANSTNAASHAVATMADDLNVSTIVSLTSTGFTARMVSRYRPNAPIIAITDKENVCRKLNLIWGVQGVMVEKSFEELKDNMSEYGAAKAKELGFAKAGDDVVVVAGYPVGVAGSTNTIKVEKVK